MIQRGAAACEATGIPLLHADAFQEVADATGNVIASRAVGKYATGPILEGYASKGFHNKAKSCNWGPMAGFVLDDPRFTKVGGTAKGRDEQAHALLHAIAEAAVEVPLYISEARRRWLTSQLLIDPISAAPGHHRCQAVSPWGLALDFRLQRARPQGANEDMWAVQYKAADRQSARATGAGGDGEWIAVMAMRDPLCTIPAADYRAATTGDYDLFAIWARKANYSPGKLDMRLVANADLERRIKAGHGTPTGEDAHLGNVTPRILAVREALNTAIVRRGYTGGNMVHHSDEGGRPFVNDIDLPVFAVIPGKRGCYAMLSVEDLRQFITQELDRQYAPVFHPGWMRQLVFAGRDGGTDLKAELLAKTAHRR
ncbi:MAG: Toxin subunit [Phenylobacterium sp.]|nr:Toxin subunit [Phenylobacterium sp.]